jgi:F0F1-type ATP synthase assembly protein I
MDKWIPALRLTGIGFYIATCIVGGTLIGWWLGDKQPVYMIIGLVVGLILAVYGVYRMIRGIIDEQKKRENN